MDVDLQKLGEADAVKALESIVSRLRHNTGDR